ncbi:MAG: GNAT family N-acetyltransferase [Alphaproteobacteria bacterium]|nr:GNAT family N-acetyltransferase [Alphaproteobacteria bacterium]
MKNNISIREAKNVDSKNIINLIFDIWTQECGFKVHQKDFPDLHQIEDFYQLKGGLFLVAVINEEIVGTIAYDKITDTVFILKRMFVRKDFRQLGVAQRLLDTLLEKKISIPLCSFFLSTKEDLALAAKKLYLKNGFKIIERQDLPTQFPFFYEDDLFMVKNFDS